MNVSSSSGDMNKNFKSEQMELLHAKNKELAEEESKEDMSKNSGEKTVDQSKPSQFQANGSKRRSNYNHLKSGSTEGFIPNSLSELKQFDGGNTMVSSPTSPRSNKGSLAEIFSFNSEKTDDSTVSRWGKFKTTVSQPSKLKQISGRCMMGIVALGSFFLIWKISTNSNGNSWPWGFWYVAALIFDQCIFQPVTTALQFIFLYRFVQNSMKSEWKKASFTRLLIGNDIMAVVESKLNIDK